MIAQDIEKVLLSEEEIENRCVELAHQIEADYKESGDTPIIVGLLKGSVPFMAELIKRFEFPCEIDFIRWNRIYWRCSYFKGYGLIL